MRQIFSAFCDLLTPGPSIFVGHRLLRSRSPQIIRFVRNESLLRASLTLIDSPKLSYSKAVALPNLLLARFKKKPESSSELEAYHTEGRAPLFLATIPLLHQSLEAAKGERSFKTAGIIYNQHLATWKNTSRTYQNNINKEARDSVERRQRLGTHRPRRRPAKRSL